MEQENQDAFVYTDDFKVLAQIARIQRPGEFTGGMSGEVGELARQVLALRDQAKSRVLQMLQDKLGMTQGCVVSYYNQPWKVLGLYFSEHGRVQASLCRVRKDGSCSDVAQRQEPIHVLQVLAPSVQAYNVSRVQAA